MSIGRNNIYAALFALLQGAPGFATYGERLKFPSDAAAQPALYLRRGDDEYLPRTPATRPATVILECEIIIYYNATDDNEIPVIELDTLVENVELVLKPAFPAEQQTLGGLVQRAYIEGTIKRDDGALWGQAGAIIPVKILTTS